MYVCGCISSHCKHKQGHGAFSVRTRQPSQLTLVSSIDLDRGAVATSVTFSCELSSEHLYHTKMSTLHNDVSISHMSALLVCSCVSIAHVSALPVCQHYLCQHYLCVRITCVSAFLTCQHYLCAHVSALLMCQHYPCVSITCVSALLMCQHCSCIVTIRVYVNNFI